MRRIDAYAVSRDTDSFAMQSEISSLSANAVNGFPAMPTILTQSDRGLSLPIGFD